MRNITLESLRPVEFRSAVVIAAIAALGATMIVTAPAVAEEAAGAPMAKPAGAEKAAVPVAKPAGSAVEQVAAQIAKLTLDKSDPAWRTKLTKPTVADFSAGKTYNWILETTQGTIKIELMPKVAPMHVTSTIYLTQLGFYDSLTFHRVIPGFMAQGGCPLGNGTGGPGYKYAGEFDDSAKHDGQGVLSMANAGPNTDGSQFFLTFGPTPHLNGRHTVFGKVVEGHAALKALEALGSSGGRPTETLVIKKATIEVK
jgi:peptidyl-prolyl cis-trans isomerase B (cyclophilin B)